MTAATAPNIIDRLVQRAQRLYSLPAVAMKVVELTNQEQVDAKALRDCIENDPALTAKILRVVNSSLFGLTRQVDDLNQAVAMLGTKPLKLLVLGFSLPDGILTGMEAEVLGRYWRHTLIKAVAARQISEQLFDMSGDDAFLAGLFQEIGVLVLIQNLGDPYVEFLNGVVHEGGDLSSFETSTLGFDHAVLSGRLLDCWGLPETLVAVVSVPHEETRILALEEKQRTLAQALHLAELLARFLISGRPNLLDEILATGGLYCDLTMQQLEALIKSMEQLVPQLAEILSLKLPGDVDYATILASAYAQISAAAEEATTDLVAKLPSPNAELAKCAERFAGDPMYDRQAEQRADEPSGTPQADAPVSFNNTPDPGLAAHVGVAVTACRQKRQGLSLLLVEIDNYSAHLLTRGPDGAERAVRRLRAVIDRTRDGDGKAIVLSDVRFAVILPDYERQAAVQLARRLVDNVRAWSLEEAQRGLSAISVSVGLATLAMPPKNFPPPELIEAAERCLTGVQLSGGDSVKSIDIC